MIYPLLSLYDGTEFTYTDLQVDGKIIVYVETPNAIDGFHSLECVLPSFQIRNVQGYSESKQAKIVEIIRNNVDKIVAQCFSFKEYSLLMNQIEELTKKVEFYGDSVELLLEEIVDSRLESMGEGKAKPFELSPEAEALMQRNIKGERPASRIIDLRQSSSKE